MNRILPIIVLSQFCCTSVWFAGNAVMADIVTLHDLEPGFLAHLVSAVQFGFISGTLLYALLTIADRFSPSAVFFTSSIIAALCNLGIIISDVSTFGLLGSRFLTGFFLAGIYPVGMKIASDHYREGLGRSLGFLVGALVLGTALPHLVKNFTAGLPWKWVILSSSGLCVAGGLALCLLVPDGPYRKKSTAFDIAAFLKGFKQPAFRSAAFGYFGHMWELYTFWAFVPVMLGIYKMQYPNTGINIPLLSFLIIASGALACVCSGLLSQQYGAKRVAGISLFLSCLCCLASPFFLLNASPVVLIVFLFFWGLVVIADSPMFSTLVAQSAPAESRGTSLTIVNCIGFSITIISIQFINFMSAGIDPKYLYMLLAIGPVLGLIALFSSKDQLKPTKR